MKLHELKPAEGSTSARRRVGRGLGSGMGKTATRGTRVSTLEPAAAHIRDLKAASFHCIAVSRNAALKMSLQKNML